MKCFVFLQFFILIGTSYAVELTFELPDNQKECFHEDIKKGEPAVVDFQVLDGGNYDVDATLTGPNGQILFQGVKKSSDTYEWTTDQTGVYKLCFSNEFSTFTHKLIYVSFEVGEEKPLPGIEEHPTMTKMESSSKNVHERLNTIIEYQTHHKLNEAKGRHFAEELNTRVVYYSIAEACVLLVVGVGQIMIMKSFFTDKK